MGKTLYRRTGTLAVLLAGGITQSRDRFRMSAVGVDALPQIACTLSSVDVYSG